MYYNCSLYFSIFNIYFSDICSAIDCWTNIETLQTKRPIPRQTNDHWYDLEDDTSGYFVRTDKELETISSISEEKCEKQISFNDKSWKFIKPNEMEEVV